MKSSNIRIIVLEKDTKVLDNAVIATGTVLPAGKTVPDGITTKAKYHPS